MSLAQPDQPVAAVRFAGPAQLVAGVPFLLGFTPTRSVVLVAMSRGVVVWAARLDLPDPQPARRGPARAVARALLQPLARSGADAAVVVLYPADAPADGEPVALAVADALRDALADTPVRLLDVLVVAGGRWRSAECHDPACCPPEGSPVPVPDVDVRAAFALAGRAPLPSRADVCALVAAAPAAARRRCSAALDAATSAATEAVERSGADGWRRGGYDAAVSVLEREGDGRDERDVATLLLAAADIRVRDALLAWAARCDDRDRLQRALAAWCDATRRAPAGAVAPAASLAAAAAHLLGDGALAHAALDRATADEPEYTLARLLRDGLEAGLPPSEVARVLAVFRPEELLLDP